MSDLCLPRLGRGFLHHPSDKLDSDELNGFGPCDEATSCPCAPVGLLPPVELMSPQSTYLHTERPTGAIHGSWSPLAPCKEQGIWTFLENHSKMSSFSVPVVLRLIYLLWCGLFWNLERDNKGKTNPQGWVAESLHSGLWVFVPVARQPQQVARPLAPQWATLAFGVGFWIDEPHFWLEDFSVALLCSQALGEVSQLFIIAELTF